MENKPILKVLREPEALDRLGLRSKQHFRQLIAAGLMPKPIRLGKNSVGWLEHEIDEALRARIAERDATLTNITAPTAVLEAAMAPA
jgi:prophage regulatory protein